MVSTTAMQSSEKAFTASVALSASFSTNNTACDSLFSKRVSVHICHHSDPKQIAATTVNNAAAIQIRFKTHRLPSSFSRLVSPKYTHRPP